MVSPVRITPLPARVNAPAPGWKVMPLKEVPTAKSLLVVRLVVPPNNSGSPATGATSPAQLAAVVQLPSPPPPSHVAAHVVLVKIQEQITAPNNAHTHRVRNIRRSRL